MQRGTLYPFLCVARGQRIETLRECSSDEEFFDIQPRTLWPEEDYPELEPPDYKDQYPNNTSRAHSSLESERDYDQTGHTVQTPPHIANGDLSPTVPQQSVIFYQEERSPRQVDTYGSPITQDAQGTLDIAHAGDEEDNAGDVEDSALPSQHDVDDGLQTSASVDCGASPKDTQDHGLSLDSFSQISASVDRSTTPDATQDRSLSLTVMSTPGRQSPSPSFPRSPGTVSRGYTADVVHCTLPEHSPEVVRKCSLENPFEGRETRFTCPSYEERMQRVMDASMRLGGVSRGIKHNGTVELEDLYEGPTVFGARALWLHEDEASLDHYSMAPLPEFHVNDEEDYDPYEGVETLADRYARSADEKNHTLAESAAVRQHYQLRVGEIDGTVEPKPSFKERAWAKGIYLTPRVKRRSRHCPCSLDHSINPEEGKACRNFENCWGVRQPVVGLISNTGLLGYEGPKDPPDALERVDKKRRMGKGPHRSLLVAIQGESDA
ncbi:hypothetical protein BGZ94_007089 [Podila epigama]|nr:hypothetical protein BGZ94_007089 [Podila epigama]